MLHWLEKTAESAPETNPSPRSSSLHGSIVAERLSAGWTVVSWSFSFTLLPHLWFTYLRACCSNGSPRRVWPLDAPTRPPIRGDADCVGLR